MGVERVAKLMARAELSRYKYVNRVVVVVAVSCEREQFCLLLLQLLQLLHNNVDQQTPQDKSPTLPQSSLFFYFSKNSCNKINNKI